MLADAPLVGFAPATDLERARAFYSDTLGLPAVSEDDFALVYRVGNATLRVAKVESLTPQPFTVLGWSVADVVATARWLRERGVAFERYPFVQDPDGIWTSPTGARIAWFKDPEGNVLSISQSD